MRNGDELNMTKEKAQKNIMGKRYMDERRGFRKR